MYYWTPPSSVLEIDLLFSYFLLKEKFVLKKNNFFFLNELAILNDAEELCI